MSKPSGSTYAEAVFSKYSGKKVEILFDSDWGVRMYSDFQVNNKPTIIGHIVGADGDCLDILVNIKSKQNTVEKVLSINSWAILSISEYTETSQVFAFTKQVLGKQ